MSVPKYVEVDYIESGAFQGGECEVSEAGIEYGEKVYVVKTSTYDEDMLELVGLRKWKEETLVVLDQIDIQAIGKELTEEHGNVLGAEIYPLVLPAIRALKAQVAHFASLLERVTARARKIREVITVESGERIEDAVERVVVNLAERIILENKLGLEYRGVITKIAKEMGWEFIPSHDHGGVSVPDYWEHYERDVIARTDGELAHQILEHIKSLNPEA